MIQHTSMRHMAIGGSVFLGYDLIHEALRYHDHQCQRPMIVDHLVAMSVIGTVGGFMASNSLRGAFQGFLFFGINFGFLSYWAFKQGMRPGAGASQSKIFYDADVSKEEKERFEM